MAKGLYLSVSQKRRIIQLLAETDMSLGEIAARTRCSRSAIASLNRKAGVRFYEGRRSQWILAQDEASQNAQIERVSNDPGVAARFQPLPTGPMNNS